MQKLTKNKSASAGIYLHIPYCRHVCYYCDFHFSLSFRDKDQMIAAMLREMAIRRNYLPADSFQTIYFGGGTPSALTLRDIELLLGGVVSLFQLSAGAEITLEANPDDLTPAYLAGLLALGVNRLSIGVQSFHDRELKRMGRRHSATDALRSVEMAYDGGFSNISLDLIYGLPDSTLKSWSHSLEAAIALSPPHLSCYHLAFEEKTAFSSFRKKGQLDAPTEEVSWAQYELLCERMTRLGYRHYEIANFALEGKKSRHNSGYWQDMRYLGIGPAAHSFDGVSRQWSIAHNRKYREGIEKGWGFSEKEVLSDKARFHDYLLTGLRTDRGVRHQELEERFGDFCPAFYRRVARYLDTDLVEKVSGGYRLTEKGMFQSDAIIADLFLS